MLSGVVYKNVAVMLNLPLLTANWQVSVVISDLWYHYIEQKTQKNGEKFGFAVIESIKTFWSTLRRLSFLVYLRVSKITKFYTGRLSSTLN